MSNQQMHPNTRQVGGKHYTAAYQHWDLVADSGMGYFEGQITKYVTRWQKKSGAQDVEKAIHYFEKLVSLYQEGRMRRDWRMGASVTNEFFEKFKEANKLSTEEVTIFIGLLQYKNISELIAIGPLLHTLLKKAQRYGATPYAKI
jgi:uncharacterized protein DUF3310